MSCRHECSCPSQLHHDVDMIVRRYDAPIPPPSASWIVDELRAALEASDEVELDRVETLRATRAARSDFQRPYSVQQADARRLT